jgi:hypothetical protein
METAYSRYRANTRDHCWRHVFMPQFFGLPQSAREQQQLVLNRGRMDCEDARSPVSLPHVCFRFGWDFGAIKS